MRIHYTGVIQGVYSFIFINNKEVFWGSFGVVEGLGKLLGSGFSSGT